MGEGGRGGPRRAGGRDEVDEPERDGCACRRTPSFSARASDPTAPAGTNDCDKRSCWTYTCTYAPGVLTDSGSLGPGADASKVRKWGTGGPGYNIDAEFNERKHEFGVLSMARSASPNSVRPCPAASPRPTTLDSAHHRSTHTYAGPQCMHACFQLRFQTDGCGGARSTPPPLAEPFP